MPWPRLDPLARPARHVATRLTGEGLEFRAPPIAEHGVVRFVSRWLRDEYARLSWFARDEGILPAGVEVDAIAALRSAPPRTPPHRLVFAGRIHPTKGLDVAVRALADTTNDVTLTVVGNIGDATYYDEVRRLARDVGMLERVEWRGEVPRAEVLQLLATEDVLVYPSIGAEAYSLGMLEAFAAGIVVVTSAVGGPREYLEHDVNALVFEPGDASALAVHLSRLGRDAKLVQTLVAGGRKTAERLSLAGVVDQLEETVARVARSGGA